VGVVGTVQFGLLGPLEVTVDGGVVDIGTPKERQLLAILLVGVNTVVSIDRLVDGLWAESPPAKPLAGLRAYVSNLRRALSNGDVNGKDILVTESSGYSLRIDPERLDAVRFELLIARAQTDPTMQSADSVAATLDEALALVRGQPIADMEYEEFAQQEIRRLSELIVSTEERRAELAIEMGDAARWLPRIAALASAHPLRERLTGAHMTALAMTGRHGEALRSYQDHRHHLVDEMGIEPGHALRAIEASILAQDDLSADESLDRSEPTSTTSSTRPAIEAERRQLTIMSCGLADTVGLSAELDPEDLKALMSEHHAECATAIARVGGWLKKAIGDGVLAYFGYPQAHEDDPERAVRAGLDIVADSRLAVCVGIATGTVVVEASSKPEIDTEPTVVGEAPSLAVQLRNAAEPDALLTSDRTHELTKTRFRFTNLGENRFRVDGLVRAGVQFQMSGADATPLVGRDEELALLLKRWELARNGDGQVVLLSGEAGIGKSRLIQALHAGLSDVPHSEIRFQCSTFHENTALHPIIGYVEALAGFSDADAAPDRLRKLESLVASSTDSVKDATRLMAAIVSIEGGPSVADLVPDPELRRSRLLDAVVHRLEAEAETVPLICVFEDAHWIDPTTLELLERLVDRTPTLQVLLLVTHRPQFAVSFEGVANTTSLRLGPVARSECVEIARSLSGGKRLPPEVEDTIVEKSDGIPLFVEEVTKAVLDGDLLEEGDDAYLLAGPLPTLAVPATLHDSLMARLDRLSSAKSVAQLAAAIGTNFDYALLALVAGDHVEGLEDELADLVAAGIIMQRGEPPASSYRFKHGLIREIAHQSMLRETRRDHHRRIAEVLESQRPDVVTSDPGLLARHWQEAGSIDNAIGYWQRASDHALETSALDETVDNVSRGLALLEQIPEFEVRARAEIALLLTKGLAQAQLLGPFAPDVRDSYDRILAHEASARTTEQHYRALWGKWNCDFGRPDVTPPMGVAEELLELARGMQDPALLLTAHHLQWTAHLIAGELELAWSHTEQGREIYQPDLHHWLTYSYGGHDPGVCMYSARSQVLWLCGSPTEAMDDAKACFDLAIELGHSYTLLTGVTAVAWIALLNRDAESLRFHSDAIIDLALKGKVPPAAMGLARGCQGAALVESGQVAEGLALMRDSSLGWRSLWGSACFPLDTVHTEAMAETGDVDGALQNIDTLLAMSERSHTPFWDAEFYRLRGKTLAHEQPDDPECEMWMRHAVDLARSQGAVMLELRAATTLARHLQQSDSQAEAAADLDTILSGLPADPDVGDIREARDLMTQLDG
jgi:DNA-binding SARP family transcriptional activator